MTRDTLFSRQPLEVTDFTFDEATATVFDDMVRRSVPFYAEIQRMVTELAGEFATSGTTVYDLGCSTGTTLLALDGVVDSDVRLVGIDNAPAMLAIAEKQLSTAPIRHPYELRLGDLNQPIDLREASVVIMVLTLQFVRPLRRNQLLKNIAESFNCKGCLIIVEKITMEDPTLNRLFIHNYYEMKKREGYSELEISSKREALENVLIPYRYEENKELILSAGFRNCEEFFRWYNFSGLIAVK